MRVAGQYLYLQMEILLLLELLHGIQVEMVIPKLVMFVFMKILEAHGLK